MMAEKGRHGIKHAAGFCDNFRTDAVTGQQDDFCVHALDSLASAGWAAVRAYS
ncbi:hypothetical protein Verru16b_03452 [Lacunisphaera limnophila]|uniref:Uncharacterized protein n=1 Tax=Lacunisphaera limnophila TaxID=1838286 RepID=A0A1D8AZM3_9BACT|nr:hypothetical protein Verru16b_03452 [Lacunisphaera limnophila]